MLSDNHQGMVQLVHLLIEADTTPSPVLKLAFFMSLASVTGLRCVQDSVLLTWPLVCTSTAPSWPLSMLAIELEGVSE